ncbi:hypothetical protein BT67DRAFT_461621 [Trichocladium antarcticum]|uniref:DUF1308 domain-containing protein n=1 Tax=Trichocladium antarcticum TaxID=1450529 RepID=A0AAN6UM32_9PEZI|nr:hypothetical protein BT67DRAFT_461621 [Trichocladium antarcticum]
MTNPCNKSAQPWGDAVLDDCIATLIAQWQICIEQLQRLQDAAEGARRPVRGLNSLLKVQQRALDKVTLKQRAASAPAISQAQYFGIKSCCWDDRWAVIKKCRGLVAINKDFPRSPRMPAAPDAGWLAYKDQPFQERPVAVDAVVDSGATWIKFISISPKTLEYQVMAEGWASESESEDEDDDGHAGDKGLGHTEFADAINKIVLAARWNHCHRLHLILPGLREGTSEVVDRMLQYIRRKIGGDDVAVQVSCAGSPFLHDAPPLLDDALTALTQDRDPLVADDCGRLTETVNLDPSALVALITDLHHGPVTLQPESQQRIIAKSILDHETENNHELVPRQDILATVLYPALRGRKLVCTESAAAYFRRLVDAIATHSEETRAALILPPAAPPDSSPPTQAPGPALQQWSTIPVPADLHLPVRIVPDITSADVDALIAAGTLPRMARGIAADLSPLNRAVYCYGWARRLSTVTGHRGIERQVRLAVARHWTRDETALPPPDVWHRHLGGYLIHRDKPKDWRGMVPAGAEVPWEVVRWTRPWTTWGRGISTYGLPDTKTWEGVGHGEKQGYGRREERKLTGGSGGGEKREEGEQE